MCALCLASKLDRVAGMLDHKGPVAISGFSDAKHVFAAEILEPVLRELLAESLTWQTGPIKVGPITPEIIRIFDRRVWKVVTRRKWAAWRHQHCKQNAVRQMLKPGEFYLGDRNYGSDFAMFDHLEARGCGYVLCLRNEARWEIIENHLLTPEAVAEGG